MRSLILNVVAPRCELAMDNLTRNQTPKIMAIEIAANMLKRNWHERAKTEVLSQSSPSKIVFMTKKSK
jgi:hypothetical protein